LPTIFPLTSPFTFIVTLYIVVNGWQATLIQHQNDTINNVYPTTLGHCHYTQPKATLLPTYYQLFANYISTLPLNFIIIPYIVVNYWLRYRPTSSIYQYNICLICWIQILQRDTAS